MSVFVIACVTINPDAKGAFEEYTAVTEPLLRKAGAKISQQFPVGDQIVGDKPAEMIIVVEYPSLEALHSVFQSDAYKAIIPLRDKAFSTYKVSMIS